MRAPGSFTSREHRIEISFLNIRLETIDTVQGRVCIDGDGIWTVADDISMFMMQPVEIQVSGTFPGMIHRIPICDTSKERTGVLGQRVEGQSIHDECTCLLGLSARGLATFLMENRPGKVKGISGRRKRKASCTKGFHIAKTC